MPFSERFRRRFSLGPSVVIELCFALRSRYPAGDDSTAISSAVASSIFSVSPSFSIRYKSAANRLCPHARFCTCGKCLPFVWPAGRSRPLLCENSRRFRAPYDFDTLAKSRDRWFSKEPRFARVSFRKLALSAASLRALGWRAS
jgi:hypothetical protein